MVVFKRIFWMLGALMGSAVFLFTFLNWANPAAASGLIIVNPGESIQAAIDGASAGDTILITAGTYTESLTLNKPVSLTGVSSATTILHAEPNDRVLTVTGAAITEQVVISGLMVTGGDISGPPINLNSGGGIALINSAFPIIQNVKFYDNKAQDVGGALYSAGKLKVSKSLIISNTSEDFGGGIFSGSDLTIFDSVLSNNDSADRGGGAYINFGTTILIESVFQNNFCGPLPCVGGGFYSSDGNVFITNTIFANNSADEAGGAYVGGSVWVEDSLFESNLGGGLFARYGTIRSTNSVFSGNFGNGSTLGGGLFSEELYLTATTVVSNSYGGTSRFGAGAYATESAFVVNSYFANNRCLVSEFCVGGGLLVFSLQNWATLNISNSIFVNNTVNSEGGGLFVSGPAIVQNTSFFENRCNDDDCNGGGLAAYGPLTLTNNIFINNFAEHHGGAVYASEDLIIKNEGGGGTELYSVNNLFAENGSGVAGAALYLESRESEILHNTIATSDFISGHAFYIAGGLGIIRNTIIASHEIGIENAGGLVLEDFNIFANNTITLLGLISSPGSSVFGGNPDFINPAGGDFHIGADSDALDNALDLGVQVDLDGIPRPQGQGPDRGAYEMFKWEIFLPVVFKS